MQYRTAEEKLLADYTALEAKCETLEEELGMAHSTEAETDEAAYRIDRPVELATVSVDTYWYDSDTCEISKMTSGELRDACKTRAGLERIAETSGRYSSKVAYVSKRVWPYQISALGATFAVDFSDYSGRVSMSETLISDPAKLDTSGWFPVECEADLYDLALEKLKTALLERAGKLEAKEREAVSSDAD